MFEYAHLYIWNAGNSHITSFYIKDNADNRIPFVRNGIINSIIK